MPAAIDAALDELVGDMSLTRTRRSAARYWPGLQITANNLAKRIKRVAFGVTNWTYWRVRILLYAGRPDWSKLATIAPAAP